MHTPVLLQEAIDQLNVIPNGRYIDATFGQGGYSQKIVSLGGRVLAIDLDHDQVKNFDKKENGLRVVQGNFKDIESIAYENEFAPVDGVVFDLGLSMDQLSGSKRGFSYKNLNDPLDMRIDIDQENTASQLIKGSSVNRLYEIFAKNSEEIYSQSIAEKVFYASRANRMKTVGDLIRAIDMATGSEGNTAVYRRIFQALRIEVNHEFENLKEGLAGAIKILNEKGRLVIVTFHSLEDRIVKNFVRSNGYKFLEKKPIRGKKKFERSAKLRVITI